MPVLPIKNTLARSSVEQAFCASVERNVLMTRVYFRRDGGETMRCLRPKTPCQAQF